jgi:hypothetical protein
MATLTPDGKVVTVRFKDKDGRTAGYVRADQYDLSPRGIHFTLHGRVVAGLGPLKLIIYRDDGHEVAVDRDHLDSRCVEVDGSRTDIDCQ